MDYEKFVRFDNEGFISCPTSSFGIDHFKDGEFINNKMEIFQSIYLLCKKRLDAQFYGFSSDLLNPLFFKNEKDFLNYKIRKNDYFTLSIDFSLPVYWFDIDLGLKKIKFDKAARLVLFSVKEDNKYGSSFGLALHFNHNLFSNHIATLDTFGTFKPELHYFEPAAIINRLKIRNLALEIKATMPFLEIEFSAYKTRIEPYDKYGFLEGADIVV